MNRFGGSTSVTIPPRRNTRPQPETPTNSTQHKTPAAGSQTKLGSWNPLRYFASSPSNHRHGTETEAIHPEADEPETLGNDGNNLSANDYSQEGTDIQSGYGHDNSATEEEESTASHKAPAGHPVHRRYPTNQQLSPAELKRRRAEVAAAVDASSRARLAEEGKQKLMARMEARKHLNFRPDITPRDQEYQDYRARIRRTLCTTENTYAQIMDEVAEKDQQLLLLPSLDNVEIVKIQKKHTELYKASFQSNFRGEKDNVFTKFAMLKFGLPIEPLTNRNLEALTLNKKADDDMSEDVDDPPEEDKSFLGPQRILFAEKPLEFLDGYDQRSFGYPMLRRPKMRGGAGSLEELRTTYIRGGADSPDHHQTTHLRGGAGSFLELKATENKGLLYGFNGIVEFPVNGIQFARQALRLLGLDSGVIQDSGITSNGKWEFLFETVYTTETPMGGREAIQWFAQRQVTSDDDLKVLFRDEHLVRGGLSGDKQHYEGKIGTLALFVHTHDSSLDGSAIYSKSTRKSPTFGNAPVYTLEPISREQNIIYLYLEDDEGRSWAYWKLAKDLNADHGINQVQDGFQRAARILFEDKSPYGEVWVNSINIGFGGLAATQDLWDAAKVALKKKKLGDLTPVIFEVEVRPPTVYKYSDGVIGISVPGGTHWGAYTDSREAEDPKLALQQEYEELKSLAGISFGYGEIPDEIRVWPSSQDRTTRGEHSFIIKLKSFSKPDQWHGLAQLSRRALQIKDKMRNPKDLFCVQMRPEYKSFTVKDPIQKKYFTWTPGEVHKNRKSKGPNSPFLASSKTACGSPLQVQAEDDFMDALEHFLYKKFDPSKESVTLVQAQPGLKFVITPDIQQSEWQLSVFDWLTSDIIHVTRNKGDVWTVTEGLWGSDYPHPQGTEGEEPDDVVDKYLDFNSNGNDDDNQKEYEYSEAPQQPSPANDALREFQKEDQKQFRGLASHEATEKGDTQADSHHPRRSHRPERNPLDSANPLAEDFDDEQSDAHPIQEPPRPRINKERFLSQQAGKPTNRAWNEFQKAERALDDARQNAYTTEVSVVEPGHSLNLDAPIYGHVREVALSVGSSVPTVYHQHITPTELAKLQDENQFLRNTILKKITSCQICDKTWPAHSTDPNSDVVNDDEKNDEAKRKHFEEHSEQLKSAGRCPLCDSKEWQFMSQEEKKNHFVNHVHEWSTSREHQLRDGLKCPVCHVELTASKFDSLERLVEHLAKHVPGLYKYCHKCGIYTWRMLPHERSHHTAICIKQPERLPITEIEAQHMAADGLTLGFGRAVQNPHFCGFCGTNLAFRTPNDELEHTRNCSGGKPGQLSTEQDFCKICGLEVLGFEKHVRKEHISQCKTPGGVNNRFCRLCGKDMHQCPKGTTEYDAHQHNCRYVHPPNIDEDELERQKELLQEERLKVQRTAEHNSKVSHELLQQRQVFETTKAMFMKEKLQYRKNEPLIQSWSVSAKCPVKGCPDNELPADKKDVINHLYFHYYDATQAGSSRSSGTTTKSGSSSTGPWPNQNQCLDSATQFLNASKDFIDRYSREASLSTGDIIRNAGIINVDSDALTTPAATPGGDRITTTRAQRASSPLKKSPTMRSASVATPAKPSTKISSRGAASSSFAVEDVSKGNASTRKRKAPAEPISTAEESSSTLEDNEPPLSPAKRARLADASFHPVDEDEDEDIDEEASPRKRAAKGKLKKAESVRSVSVTLASITTRARGARGTRSVSATPSLLFTTRAGTSAVNKRTTRGHTPTVEEEEEEQDVVPPLSVRKTRSPKKGTK